MDPLDRSDSKRLGGITLRGRLGIGGMGRVFYGVTDDYEPVAVKVIRAELLGRAEIRARFAREIEALRTVVWPLEGMREGELRAEWSYNTPLRAERERRAALVELDALVALWLGMTAEQLVAIYRSRYPVLSDYEAKTWFDADGRKIASNHNTYGYGQTKAHYEQLLAHFDPEINGPVPDGYAAPFYKADREAEYRQAHAVFAERLRQAQAVQGDIA